MHGSTVRGAAVLACALVAVLSACATTIDDQPADGEPPESGIIVDPDAPPITEPIAGSPTELLPEMAAEMSRLGSQIAEDGDAEATLDRIQRIWLVVRPEIEATRPELVGGIDTTVAMSETAVVRKRPADADKAFSLLTDLVDNYTGDG